LLVVQATVRCIYALPAAGSTKYRGANVDYARNPKEIAPTGQKLSGLGRMRTWLGDEDERHRDGTSDKPRTWSAGGHGAGGHFLEALIYRDLMSRRHSRE